MKSTAFAVSLSVCFGVASSWTPTASAQSFDAGKTRELVRDELRTLEQHGYVPQSYYWRDSLQAAQARIAIESASANPLPVVPNTPPAGDAH